jgi:benzoyl-CoA reductase/2-hydroxyglutaryl-CoA dehydratase subunit BcrC/BadD/HgdB
MIATYFEGMSSAMETRFQRHPTARNKFALEIVRLGQKLYRKNDRLAWCGVTAPFDVLNAMGVNSCFVEFVGGMLSSTGSVGPFLEEAEQAGFLADGCGYHRAVIGATEKNMMPVPDLVIATSSPCTGGIAAVEHLARKFDRPLFMLNVPPEETEQGVRYLTEQLKDMVGFVTSVTGQTLNDDALRLAMEKTNEARKYMLDAFRLAQRVPSPAAASELRNFGIVMSLFLGTDTGVEIAEAYRNEYAARLEQGTTGVPNERFRLMWMQSCIQFRNPLIRMLESDYQASVVIDELNDVFWEPIDVSDPYTGLARRMISTPFNGTFDRRLKHIEKLVHAYQIDGAINPCHWGCRQGTGARGLVESTLKRLDVPLINLEVDCVDSRNFAEGQLKTRLQAFMEMLDDRKSRGKDH